jgi:hypothetical protein
MGFWHNLEGARPAGLILTSDGTPGIISEVKEGESNEVKRVSYFSDEFLVVQQFTGLLDKHGKEIFEGDFLMTSGLFTGGLVEVFWNNMESSFRVVIPGGAGHYKGAALWEAVAMNGEVVGNVFENPDLLK